MSFKRRTDFDNLYIDDKTLHDIYEEQLNKYDPLDAYCCCYIEEDWNYCPYCGERIDNVKNYNAPISYFKDLFDRNFLPGILTRHIPFGWDELELCYNIEWKDSILSRLENIRDEMSYNHKGS